MELIGLPMSAQKPRSFQAPTPLWTQAEFRRSLESAPPAPAFQARRGGVAKAAPRSEVVALMANFEVPIYVEDPEGQVSVSDRKIALSRQFARLYLPPKIDRDTILIIVHHGFFGRSDYLDPLSRRLSASENAVVLAADLTGHGRSGGVSLWNERIGEGFPIHLPQQRAAVLLAWTRYLKDRLGGDARFQAMRGKNGGIPDPFLVGHSQGGGDVLTYFSMYANTPGIVLISAWYTNRLLLGRLSRTFPGLARAVLRGMENPQRVLADLNFTAGRKGRKYFRDHPGLVQAFADQVDPRGDFLELSVREAGSHWEDLETALDNPHFLRRLAASRSAIVLGRFDTRVPPRFSRELARRTGLPLLRLDGRHFPMLEDPERLARLIARNFRGGF